MAPDNPNPHVYDTELFEKAVQDTLDPQIRLLGELCCYGSNLIVRCYRERHQFQDLVLVGSLFRQFLVHLDAVYVLLGRSCVEGTQIHLRAMLEEMIYIKWLLQADTVKRARHFYVWNFRQRREANRWSDPTTDEGQRIEKSVGSDFPGIIGRLRTPEMQLQFQRQNEEIDRVLSNPEFAPINATFDAERTRSFDVAWYVPCGFKSVHALAKDVGLEPLYAVYYRIWSRSMHSSGLFNHLHADEDGVSIEQIRSPEDFRNAFAMAHNLAHSVFRLFIAEYRPGEIEAFCRKYVVEWRERLSNVPTIIINRENRET